MCANQSKTGGVVIERSAFPTRRRVAILTGLRKAGRYVIGIGRVFILSLMAGVAGR